MYSSGAPVPLEDRKLFIGGLGWDTTDQQIREYFEKYGHVESISVKTNPTTGRSRGFAFVVFSKSDTIDSILDGSDHVINGRKVDAKKAIARTGKIFVGGLKPELSDDDIRAYFGQYGKVVDLEVPYDKMRNARKGFCFVTFEQEHTVNELLRTPQKNIKGHQVDLRRATPKTDAPGAIRGGRGGGFGGRGGFGRGRGGYGSYGPYGPYGGYGWGGGYGGYDEMSDPSGGYGDYGPSGYGSYGYSGYGGYDYSNGYSAGSYGDYGDYGGYDSYRGGRQPQSRHQPY